MSKEILFHSHSAIFLDPGSVGSSVLYRMQADRKGPNDEIEYGVEIELRDCSRTIRWGLWVDHEDDNLSNVRVKLDRAISILKDARREIERMADEIERLDGKRP